jgi:uncharacterized repeat protein (TIGR03803 family)
MRRISEEFRFRGLTVSALACYLVLSLLAPSLADAVTFTNLHSFLVKSLGSRPLAPVALGSDGNLYGTTSADGTNGGQGAVFKVTTNGVGTLLHTFTGGADGGDAESALVQWTDSTFYGTTRGGGVYSNGTVFKITTNGALTTLVQFTGGNDGSIPVGGLVLCPDGNFYGATMNGGSNGFGTVFRLAPNGQLTTILAFRGTNGANPWAPLTLGRDGKLYGTTTAGGAHNDGTVFQITTNGALVTLYSLAPTPSDPYMPEGQLVQGADGNFYGTASSGGINFVGCVFKITTAGVLTTMYSFGTVHDSNGYPLDGSDPVGGLVFGSDGNLYGTTELGGTNEIDYGGDGTIFRITPAGVLTTVYFFQDGVDGAAPDAGLLNVGGDLYGTASQGGVAWGPLGNGTIFKIRTNGAFVLVYDLPGLDGLNPSAELTADDRGNLYGTTEYGGPLGQGTVFRYAVNGDYTVLTNFDYTHGGVPDGQLLRLADGSFLGTTLDGGAHSHGNIFRVATNGLLSTVYDFGSVTNVNGLSLDGDQPWTGLTLAPDGNYYGTTFEGGDHNAGVIFGVTTNGMLTNVVSFDGISGGYPQGANLILGPDGNLYGTTRYGTSSTNGSVFSFTPGGGLNTIYTFSGAPDGSNPQAGLTLGSDGYFYGTTISGGLFDAGTIFKITTTGLLTSLYSFDRINGAQPTATLVLGKDGSFYGTTLHGGSTGNGVIFRFSTDGTYTNLHSFTGVADGAYPDCGLTLGPDGNLYGVAEFGGAGGNGTLFELILSDPAPVLLSVKPTNNVIALSWSAVAGRIYQLQSNVDLRQNVWSNVGLPVRATNSIVAAIDPSALVARRFYRVAMLP